MDLEAILRKNTGEQLIQDELQQVDLNNLLSIRALKTLETILITYDALESAE